MNDYSYKEIISITKQALDLLNVKQFLKKDLSPSIIMADIQDYIDYSYTKEAKKVQIFMKLQYPFFGETFNTEIFNWITEDEFIDYCKERYPEVKWGYEFIEKYWVADIQTER